MNNYVVLALYKFTNILDTKQLQSVIFQRCKQLGIIGTILIAAEGINGTIAGSKDAIDEVKRFFNLDLNINDIEWKESFCQQKPFNKLKIKLKNEIVTLGVNDIDPSEQAGDYVAPKDWNEFIARDDVVLIDTRNKYEIKIGSFKGAINPETDNFREFPQFLSSIEHLKDKKIAMCCTGGIRCEKSTALLKQNGFTDVYHLKGGILAYLEQINKEENKFSGDCFVFDERVALNHDLEPSGHKQCFGCRHPLSDADLESSYYVKGVSCPYCYHSTSQTDKARFAERQKQIDLAKKRGTNHFAYND